MGASPASAPSVAVVLLNWNASRLTLVAARSALDALEHVEGDLVVVDNGSVDDSVEILRRELPTAIVVENDENLGFARGVNRGIEAALAAGHDVVLLLNNDATIAPDALSKGVDLLVSDPDIGVLGGKILTGDGRLWFTGATLSTFTAGVHVPDLFAADEGQWDLPRDVDGISMAFVLIPRRTFERIGLLCEDYFFGQEEWDFSLRARRAGLRCRFDPSLVAIHDGDGSHRNADPLFVYLSYRNKITFQQRFLPRAAFAPWLVAFLAYAVLQPETARQRRRGPLVEGRAMRRRCATRAVADHIRHGSRIELAHAQAFVGRSGARRENEPVAPGA